MSYYLLFTILIMIYVLLFIIYDFDNDICPTIHYLLFINIDNDICPTIYHLISIIYYLLF